MPLTNYPNGLSSFGMPVIGGNAIPTTTGSYFFVDSGTGGDVTGNGTKENPYATVDFAVASTTADKGDVIIVMPGHAETMSTIVLDVAGITIVCLGNGRNKPVFTFDDTADEITFAADDITWIGGLMFANKLDVATCFQVDAAKNARIEGVEFEDSSLILSFLSCVTTTTTDNDADGLEVIGCNYFALNTTPLAFVSILGDLQGLRLIGNTVDSASTADVGHFVTLASKDVLGAQIRDNNLAIVGTTALAVGIFLTGAGSASTGDVSRNYVSSLDTTSELLATTGTGLVYFDNLYTGTADTSGKVWPAADS